jgi:acyl-CoA synthetase (AMP-forming)/AMP-acid ligase II/acyl carrier protein
MLSGLAHDPLLRDLFMPLVLGARLCVPAEEQLRDPRNLIGWLRSEQVTVIHLTPPLARLMISQQDGSPAGYGGDAAILPRLRLIGLAGDQATSTDVAGLRRLAPQARLVNLYGTTETPQAQAFHEIADVRGPAPEPAVLGPAAVPVGRGIDGAQLVILGCDHRPAAVGEIGEVLIRSRYLADGYTDPRLSGEYFGRTPHDADGHRFFRTGDLGRYLADGSVMLAGRIDRQAKIRGFRVEPGEIEAILTGHPLIRQACVTITSDGGDQRLSAYAVPGGPGLSAEDVRAHLRAHLPAHAVPGAVMLLDALPLTPNGKVDAAALPAALPPAPPRPGQQPSSRTERVVAGAWREVLGLPRVELDENFFDVGGDSLAIVAVRARLERVLGVPVQVVDLFRYPTIGSLASYLDGGRKEAVFARAELRAAQRRRRASRRSTRRPSRGEQS